MDGAAAREGVGPMWNLLHTFGIDDTTGRWYAFWSGFGSDLGELAIVGAIWSHLNCHEPGCWRIARHRMDGRCRRHAVKT